MGLSKAKREAIAPLREELGKLQGDRWQRACYIMDQIVAITERKPKMGGHVCPRVCKHCGYYGHTKEHCTVREQWLEMQTQREVERDKEEREAKCRKVERPKELQWFQRASQADWFDEWRLPWYKDPWLGPMLLSPGKDGGEGKWARVQGVLTEKTALQ